MKFSLSKIIPRKIAKRIDEVVRIILLVVSVALFGAVVIDYGFTLTKAETALIYDVYGIAWWCFFLDFFGRLVVQWFDIKRKAMFITSVIGICLLLSALPRFFPGLGASGILQDVWMVFSHKYFIIPLLAILSVLNISKAIIEFISQNTNPAMLLAVAFLIVIFVGAILLRLPRSLADGASISIIDAIFISTSSVCVTGLSTIDIPATFSTEGEIVIMLLIQIGGMGVMTITTFFAVFFMGNSGLQNRFALRDMIGSGSLSSLISTLIYILGFTIVIELIGAGAIWLDIHGTMGKTLSEEFFFSIFQSISAFCNAGISNYEESMTVLANSSHRLLFITLTVLIILGGIGFPILVNLKNALFYNVRRWFRLVFFRDTSIPRYKHLTNINTKIVISGTLFLIIAGSVVLGMLEWHYSFRGMETSDKIIHSIFNAVAPRTAGFSSINLASLSLLSLMTYSLLMWIGGASQSTAGGIKVNTIAVAMANFIAVIRGRESVTLFNREISPESVRRALATIFGSLFVITATFITLVVVEPNLSPKALLFETISAISTVGSSLGVTEHLCSTSKVLIIILMFVGRVGLLTVITSIFREKEKPKYKLPKDNVIIN
ncbi:MAG: TrkH family potassium uptake protein [Muribaculaceae bacterium]